MITFFMAIPNFLYLHYHIQFFKRSPSKERNIVMVAKLYLIDSGIRPVQDIGIPLLEFAINRHQMLFLLHQDSV